MAPIAAVLAVAVMVVMVGVAAVALVAHRHKIRHRHELDCRCPSCITSTGWLCNMQLMYKCCSHIWKEKMRIVCAEIKGPFAERKELMLAAHQHVAQGGTSV